MWQVAVAAAVAGSGLIAKHLFFGGPGSSTFDEPHSPAAAPPQINQKPFRSSPDYTISPQILQTSTYSVDLGPLSCVNGPIAEDPDGIFRFSSSGSGEKSRFRYGLKKSSSSGRNTGLVRVRKGSLGRSEGENCGKRVCASLKKRRTSNCSSSGKRSSCCCKELPSFSWGLGLGVMCMISAGKAEINKLNSTLDETAKVVEEIKGKLYVRKSSSHHHGAQSLTHNQDSRKDQQEKINGQADLGSNNLNVGPSSMRIASTVGEFEYSSSVLTEEPPPRSTDMDQLEAELEYELEKLPWSANEASDDGLTRMEHQKVEEFAEPVHRCSTSHFQGVSPSLLKEKLSRVLIKQQESQISDLESELNIAYSQLQAKESELCTLRDCVKRLTELSLATTSDEEKGTSMELDHLGSKEIGSRAVRTKRAMIYGPL